MKNCFKIIYGILSCMILFACQNDESYEIIEHPVPQPDDTGMLYDGHDINDVSLYCVEEDSLKNVFNVYWGALKYDDSKTYCLKTKTIKDYSDMQLYVTVNTDHFYYDRDRIRRYGIEDGDETEAIIDLLIDYYENRTSFLVTDFNNFHVDFGLNPWRYKNYKDKNIRINYKWPELFSAYLNGYITITCDKTLYGELPGTNLSKHFNVISQCGCLPVGIELIRPEFHFGEELPLEMEKFFINRAVIEKEYYLQFREQPTEKYDNLTFYISIPMTIEHSLDYVVAKYKGYDLDSKYTEAEFKAECLINFNWD